MAPEPSNCFSDSHSPRSVIYLILCILSCSLTQTSLSRLSMISYLKSVQGIIGISTLRRFPTLLGPPGPAWQSMGTGGMEGSHSLCPHLHFPWKVVFWGDQTLEAPLGCNGNQSFNLKVEADTSQVQGKTPRYQCRGPRLDSWSGELDPVWHN